MAERFKPIYTLLYNKYYIDEIYDAVILQPALRFAKFMWSFDANVIDGAVNGTGWLTMRWSDIKMWFDKWVIDGAVNGAGWLVRQGSALLRFVQNGAVQFYVLFALALAVLTLALKYVSTTGPAELSGTWIVIIVVAFVTLLVLFGRAVSRDEAAAQETKSEE
jgi:NADH-quinone oxidoreductase subunit L